MCLCLCMCCVLHFLNEYESELLLLSAAQEHFFPVFVFLLFVGYFLSFLLVSFVFPCGTSGAE